MTKKFPVEYIKGCFTTETYDPHAEAERILKCLDEDRNNPKVSPWHLRLGMRNNLRGAFLKGQSGKVILNDSFRLKATE